MKKLIVLFSLITIMSTVSFAFFPIDQIVGLFGGGKVSIATEVHSLKDSTDKRFSDIKAGLNDISNQMAANNNEIGVLKDNNLSLAANLKLQTNAVAGLNNTVSDIKTSMSAGHDLTSGSNNTTTQTNDSELMKYIFQILSGIFMAIISALGVIVKMQGKLIGQLTNSNAKLMTDRDEDYDKLVSFQSQMLSDIIKSKDEYKAKYLELVKPTGDK